ncbi:unnamed protein product [Phytophthora lilii]|uniref:Unnamed protein product n=1 Tax=Phytophthora lilii TaxID=2077276 RepID=A0A9W6TI24_9STRA|nr:unnamed protein product [Phytophthora lilii]
MPTENAAYLSFLTLTSCCRSTQHYQEGLHQSISLALDNGHEHVDRPHSSDQASVPIIISAPSTPRFELSLSDEAPMHGTLLRRGSPLTCTIRFNRPEPSESDYAWDNFQDQVVVHTKLSKLVLPLQAWKNEVPLSPSCKQEGGLLFPVSLPNVKAPPLRLFGAIVKRNAVRQHEPSPGRTEIIMTSLPSMSDTLSSVPITPRAESLPPLSRPGSSARQSSPRLPPCEIPVASMRENVALLPPPEVTGVQSQREAREVILKLRCQRKFQSIARVPSGSSLALVSDATELFPETVALDAGTIAELEEFNNLVVAARERVTEEAAKAKSELAYFQQLIPVPPARAISPVISSNAVPHKSRKTRQMSASIKRPSKLPSLSRPSSGSFSNVTGSLDDSLSSLNNQEISPLEKAPLRRKLSARQRVLRLQSLSAPLNSLQASHKQSDGPIPLQAQVNDDNQQLEALSDFDDPDPDVDEAPVFPDDLSGVAALEADDLH